MAKTKKHIASGIDLTGLSSAQLNALVIEAQVKSREQSEKENKATKKELKDSGQLDAFQKEFLALNKEGKKLSRKITFDLLVPITFTMLTEGPIIDDEGFDFPIAALDVSDVFNYYFSAGINKNQKLLTKKQATLLNGLIEQFAEDYFEDDEIYELVPKEKMAQFDEFVNKLNDLFSRVEASGLTFNDII